MKILSRLLAVFAAIFILHSCDKADDLPLYTTGADIALNANPSTVVLTPADSNAVKVTLSWNNPAFATAPDNYKYVIEIDTSANFTNPRAFMQMEDTIKSLTGSELNNMVLLWGGQLDGTKDVYVRVRGSYGNNNDMKVSNVVKLTITPTAVPFNMSLSAAGPFTPTIDNRNELATSVSWTAPNIAGASYTYYLVYSTGTDFSQSEMIPLSGDMTADLTNLNLNAYALAAGLPVNASGTYNLAVAAVLDGTGQTMYSNAQAITITPANMVLYMYVPGDYQGWSPSTAPRLASTDGANYEGYIWVPAGGSGEFKFTSAPDWNNTNYGGTATTIDPNGGNLNWPAGTGKFYRVIVNTSTMTWSATEITTWGLIGDATPGGWDSSTPMNYDPATGKWTVTTTLNGTGQFKFRANNGWDINLGGSLTNLTYGGDNIASPAAGTYTITLDLSNPPVYTATIQ